jgi:hypothetical protein
MSDRGSPTDHATTEIPTPESDAPASAAPTDDGKSDGQDAKLSTDAPSASDKGATKEDAPKATLADVVRAAAELPDPQGSSPVPAKDGKDKDDPAPSDPTKVKPDEQDDSKLSFHQHPRWQEVTGQNRQLRTEVETLKPDAEQFRKINSFMEEHQLTPDEVGELFIVGAMAKAGDARALAKIDEFRNKLALAIGEVLPDDIQAKLDTGEISEGAAKELAKTRATAAITERQLADRTSADADAQRARNLENLRNAQALAVSEWDAGMRKTDPDFAKKENAIARYAKALMQEHGAPPTPQDAVALIKAAYAQVNKDFAAAMPAKQPVQRGPIASSSNGAKAQPKTLREAIEQAAAM